MTESASEAKCWRCGEAHSVVSCPQVKAVEFQENGDLRRVEFLTPTDCGVRVAVDPTGGAQDNYPKLGPRKA